MASGLRRFGFSAMHNLIKSQHDARDASFSLLNSVTNFPRGLSADLGIRDFWEKFEWLFQKFWRRIFWKLKGAGVEIVGLFKHISRDFGQEIFYRDFWPGIFSSLKGYIDKVVWKFEQ